MCKSKYSKALSFCLAVCFILSTLPSIALHVFAAGEFAIPVTSEVFILDGSGGNGKNKAEYMWINDLTIGVAFSVRSDKKFTGGSITLATSGHTIPLVFDEVLYDSLSVSGNTLSPVHGNDGKYVWQIATCTAETIHNNDQVILDITGPGGGFTIENYTYTLDLTYGMETSMSLVAVNDSAAGITSPVSVGDKLAWEITVLNSGDIYLSSIDLVAALTYETGLSASGSVLFSDAEPFDLAPDDSKTVTAIYYITEADAGKQLTNSISSTAACGTHAHASGTVSVNPIVTYAPNGGDYAPATQTKYPTQDLTLSSEIPTKPGYLFVSWNTSPDGLGTSYDPGSLYTEDKNLTLFAIWTIEPQYICSISAPDSIVFTFNTEINRVWNPETMCYETTTTGTWNKSSEISVTNLSNIEVGLTTEAKLFHSESFTDYEGLTLSVKTNTPGFTEISGADYTGLTGFLQTNNTCSFYLEISGTPPMTDTTIQAPLQIGVLTVKVRRPS